MANFLEEIIESLPNSTIGVNCKEISLKVIIGNLLEVMMDLISNIYLFKCLIFELEQIYRPRFRSCIVYINVYKYS